MPSIQEVVGALSTRNGVQTVLLLSRDGLTIHSAVGQGHDADGLSALLPTLVRACTAVGQEAGHGGFSTGVVEYGNGYVVVAELTADTLLAVLVASGSDLAPLLFELKRDRPALAQLVQQQLAEAHLLVIDDEAHICKIIGHICSKQPGLRCIAVHSLADARNRMSERRFEVVLLDVKLPDGSGLDFLKGLRDDPESVDIPVVVLSGAGYGDVRERVEALRAEYVPKPFSPSKLLKLVRQLIGLRL